LDCIQLYIAADTTCRSTSATTGMTMLASSPTFGRAAS
jgi:hypothetical protein